MIIPVIYTSAAEFWLDGTNRKNIDSFALGRRCYSQLPATYDFTAGKLFYKNLCEMINLRQPIFVAAPDAGSRRLGTSFYCKCMPRVLPARAFVHVGNIEASKLIPGLKKSLETQKMQTDNAKVFVAGPEMCFLQAAAVLPLEDLIELGYQLCARYIFDNSFLYAQRSREILTNRQTIVSFLGCVDSFPGLRKAKRAIRYVRDNSNSPMETRLSMFAFLPFVIADTIVIVCICQCMQFCIKKNSVYVY